MKVAAISRKSSLFVLKGFLFHSFNAPGYEITSSLYELILTWIIPVSHVQIWCLYSIKPCNGMITQWLMSYSVAVSLCLAPLLLLGLGLLVLTVGLLCRGWGAAAGCGRAGGWDRAGGLPLAVLLKRNEMIYLWIILESFLTHIGISKPLVQCVAVVLVHHGVVGVSLTSLLGVETPPERLGPIRDGLFCSILLAVCTKKHKMRWFMI